MSVSNLKGAYRMDSVQNKKNYDAIDIAKFVASILIFTMHCNVFGNEYIYNLALGITARWGVPFFFLSSAFFLFSKSENGNIKKDTLIRYVNRLMMLYVVWAVINLPNIFYQRLYSKNLHCIYTWLVFLKNSILSSTFTASWYLGSSIFSAWIVFLLSKKFRTKTVIGIVFFTYILCALSSVYCGILPPAAGRVLIIFDFPWNIFNGCVYFAIGKYVYENRESITKICTKKMSVVFFFLFYVLFAVEIYVSKYYGYFRTDDVAFSTICFAFFSFLFCLQSDIRIKNGILFRKLSIVIFCCQGNVLVVNSFLKKAGLPSFISYMVSAGIITIICFLVLYIQKQKRWKWAKYLT